ncbi:MAG: hypothetical protein V3U76_18685 [Granulosicoccus sp.]
MEIVQKKRSNIHTFSFEEEYFNFAFADKTGTGNTDIRYADFPKKFSTRIDQNDWLKNVGYLWCALGVFQLGFAMYSGESLSGKAFWLSVGLTALVWARFSKVVYTVFSTEEGSVFVIQGKRHDEIIDEINSRRKQQLMRWYGDINAENDLETEINKFNWLVDQEILSREESNTKIAQARLLLSDSFSSSSDLLN